MADFVGAVDQGTTSTRFMVFDHDGAEVARHQLEHQQVLPRPGWVEHDALEVWERTRTVIAVALNAARLSARDLAAVGITNQRETTVVWNRRTGIPYANAIVWQDTRTDRIASALDKSGRGEVIRQRAGLPPATYFSAGKLQWLLENDGRLRADAGRGDALFGTIDTWLLWNLTGGTAGGEHVTDVTNASRTMLMDLRTLDWDEELLGFFGVPRAMLPRIVPSAGQFGVTSAGGPFGGEVLIGGVLGDQHAATIGQVCFAPGEAKNTYGTGNFLVLNTGGELYASKSGLLTTVAYQLGAAAPAYALEGSVAVTGAAVQWLRDQLGIISGAAQSEDLARLVDDTSGLYFVPAFSGLFAPYWRADARGAIVGLSRFHTNAHLARATLEAICYQTRDVVEAMAADSGVTLDVLKVDGGVTANDLCMQLQADILGVPVSRPVVAETTALGAAYAAGLTAGFWRDTAELRANWRESRRWEPGWPEDRRAAGYAGWKKAINRTLNWVDVELGDAAKGRCAVMNVRMPVTAEPVGDVVAVLGEGPYWRAEDDCLLWVDIPRGLLHMTRVDAGETATVELGEVSAAFPAVGGGILTAGGHRLTLRATRPGEGWDGRTVAAAPAMDGVRFNDAGVDPAGRVWVGSMDAEETKPLGTLYRLDSGGSLTPVVPNVTVSNGLGWSPDGGRMYYADSPMRRVEIFDYDPATGEASGRRVFADLSGVEGFPDGLTVDADGCVWVAMFGGGALRRFTPSGHQDAVLPLPVSQPTSCAFGGPVLAELYVTTASRDLGKAELAAQPLAGRVLRLLPGPVGLPSTTAQAVIPS